MTILRPNSSRIQSLEIILSNEKKARDMYDDLLRYLKSGYLRDAITHLREEELNHMKFVESLIKQESE